MEIIIIILFMKQVFDFFIWCLTVKKKESIFRFFYFTIYGSASVPEPLLYIVSELK